jgi:hypothetical protein
MDSRSASVSIAFGRKQEAAGPAWDDDDRTHHSNPGVVRVHGHEWLGVAVRPRRVPCVVSLGSITPPARAPTRNGSAEPRALPPRLSPARRRPVPGRYKHFHEIWFVHRCVYWMTYLPTWACLAEFRSFMHFLIPAFAPRGFFNVLLRRGDCSSLMRLKLFYILMKVRIPCQTRNTICMVTVLSWTHNVMRLTKSFVFNCLFSHCQLVNPLVFAVDFWRYPVLVTFFLLVISSNL